MGADDRSAGVAFDPFASMDIEKTLIQQLASAFRHYPRRLALFLHAQRHTQRWL